MTKSTFNQFFNRFDIEKQLKLQKFEYIVLFVNNFLRDLTQKLTQISIYSLKSTVSFFYF